MKVSNCCGYEIGDPHFIDIGICPACKEHCDFEEVNEEEDEETEEIKTKPINNEQRNNTATI